MRFFSCALLAWASFVGSLQAQLAITEVFPAASTNGAPALHADWWELTNFGPAPVDLTGYRFNDSNGGLSNGVVTLDALVIAPGESIIFLEQNASTGLPTVDDFRTWWGTALPTGLQIIVYGTNAIGLSGNGDGVRLWDPATTDAQDPVASVDFGAATVGSSFVYDPTTGHLVAVSLAGVGGAFAAAENGDAGSPGTTTGPVPLRISRQPFGISVNPLSTATLSVEAEGMPRPRYRWQRNGEDLPGGTLAELTVTDMDASKTGTYRVRLDTGLVSVTSDPAELTLIEQPSPPSFLQKPADATNVLGGTVVFTAVATGVPPPAYQWYFNGQRLEGALAGTLVRSNLTIVDAGEYRVEATNPLGSTNATVLLTVRPKPDLRITEVESSAALDAEFLTVFGFSKQDWWELTSFESAPVRLTGWRFDDNSASLAAAYTLTNDIVIAPGESVVLVENLTAEQFRTWWGAANLPAGLQIVSYSGSGLGLSSGGDSVRLWDATTPNEGDTIAVADFGAAEPGVSFNYDPDSATFGGKSVLGVHGVFAAEAVAAGGQDIGSPGRIREGDLPPGRPSVFLVLDGGGWFVEFEGEAGRRYSLLGRDTLDAGEWTTAGDPQIPAVAGTVRFGPLAPGAGSSAFFQVLVE